MATKDSAARGAGGDPATGFGTGLYRTYVLNALLFVYILNFIDRGLLSVVARPLKAEIGISDTAWGLLTGFGFALLYTTVGIPLARVAERRNRVWIIAICLALWSLMTALCGLATDVVIGGAVIGGFWMLLLCRVGVGIGEAGCTPPANSLIADFYPPSKRATAIGYYAMGVTLGTVLANLVGGPVADAFGWRAAFYVLGLPGVAFAIVLVLTVREPPRGYTDPKDAARPASASFRESFAELASQPSFWWMTAGATVAAFCGYAVGNFQSLYLQRSFDITAGEAALWINAPSYAVGALGTVAIGWLAERLSRRSNAKIAIARLTAIGLMLCIPFYAFAFTTSSMMLCAIGLALGHGVKYGYLAAQYTIGQGVVSTRSRATATAVLLFIQNLLGYGLGPLFAGVVSDFYFARALYAAGYSATVTRSMCDAGQEALSVAGRELGGALAPDRISDILSQLGAPLNDAQYAFCLHANAASTQASMLTISVMYAFGAVCFFFCMRALARNLATSRA